MTPRPGSRCRWSAACPWWGHPKRSISATPASCGRPCWGAAVHGHGRFVVDLTRTRFCDTAGLHALVAAQRRTLTEGGQVLLVIPGTGVLRIFEITGLDRVIPHAASLEEALAQMPEARARPSADDRLQ